MSAFREMVAGDNLNTFLNPAEFGEERTVAYDGTTYTDIPVVLSGMKEKDRRQLSSDHVQGLYLVSSVMHCRLEDLGGKQPEKGSLIKIAKVEHGTFLKEYYVASSVCEMGMLRIELEAIDE